MGKIIELYKKTLIQYSIYRINFILWRFRLVINLLIIYFFWTAFFAGKSVLFGYTIEKMLTYILLSSFVSNIVLSSRTADIAGEIVSGTIMNYILKPFSFFQYQAIKDLADKTINSMFSFVEIMLLILLLSPNLYFQKSLYMLIMFIVLLFIGAILAFYLNMILSFVGFWTPEVWAPRFIFYIIIYALSGSYFPLDILPKPIYYLFLLTPFPYFYFIPVRVFLGVNHTALLLFMTIGILWILLLYYLTKTIWNRGNKHFSFFGR